MPIQTLSPRISSGSMLGQAVGQGLQSGIQQGFEQQRQQRMQQQQKSLLNQAFTEAQQVYANPNLSQQEKLIGVHQAFRGHPEIAKNLGAQIIASEKQGKGSQLLQQLFSQTPQQADGTPQQPMQPIQAQNTQQTPQAPIQQFDPRRPETWTDQQINTARAFKSSPGEEGIIGNIAENEHQRREAEKKLQKDTKESERTYHSGYSKDLEKEVNLQRNIIPKKEMALNFSRNAIETGNVGYFSPDKIADATGVDLFRTSKGAQLITAGKENLLNNMDRVSARAQNLWFEQRLNSMFPKIGQSQEANLTTQEMLEGELAIDKAYVDKFDQLSSEDEKEYGFVKKDIGKRARQAIQPKEREILRRTTYRMKEIEEQEKGLSEIKKEVGKKVVKGTPLTLAMAKLYKQKYGDKALEIAKQNGYYIPTIEEFKIFQQRPEEARGISENE